jgi:hypothetical protein
MILGVNMEVFDIGAIADGGFTWALYTDLSFWKRIRSYHDKICLISLYL